MNFLNHKIFIQIFKKFIFILNNMSTPGYRYETVRKSEQTGLVVSYVQDVVAYSESAFANKGWFAGNGFIVKVDAGSMRAGEGQYFLHGRCRSVKTAL